MFIINYYTINYAYYYKYTLSLHQRRNINYNTIDKAIDISRFTYKIDDIIIYTFSYALMYNYYCLFLHNINPYDNLLYTLLYIYMKKQK